MIAYVEKVIQVVDKGKLRIPHVNHGVMTIYCVNVVPAVCIQLFMLNIKGSYNQNCKCQLDT